MDDAERRSPERELLPLTDSLVSLVRWRVSDYAAFVKAEFDLMLGADAEDDGAKRDEH